ncbi:hypothetical protein BESB_048390 [Besnoitia besnoiti]|uniref:Uncharacterized protein n=1 Tax=Besnoitia besnoiti TaxID=94643 RepID=A0A2A9MLS9_BESBE|nr:hypothetical protein BESB_048390 [Besnoitia besnoiti]PFH36647.1 hypothetical protein BESB_048390 [Besnoitia besnoiti]
MALPPWRKGGSASLTSVESAVPPRDQPPAQGGWEHPSYATAPPWQHRKGSYESERNEPLQTESNLRYARPAGGRVVEADSRREPRQRHGDCTGAASCGRRPGRPIGERRCERGDREEDAWRRHRQGEGDQVAASWGESGRGNEGPRHIKGNSYGEGGHRGRPEDNKGRGDEWSDTTRLRGGNGEGRGGTRREGLGREVIDYDVCHRRRSRTPERREQGVRRATRVSSPSPLPGPASRRSRESVLRSPSPKSRQPWSSSAPRAADLAYAGSNAGAADVPLEDCVSARVSRTASRLAPPVSLPAFAGGLPVTSVWAAAPEEDGGASVRTSAATLATAEGPSLVLPAPVFFDNTVNAAAARSGGPLLVAPNQLAAVGVVPGTAAPIAFASAAPPGCFWAFSPAGVALPLSTLNTSAGAPRGDDEGEQGRGRSEALPGQDCRETRGAARVGSPRDDYGAGDRRERRVRRKEGSLPLDRERGGDARALRGRSEGERVGGSRAGVRGGGPSRGGMGSWLKRWEDRASGASSSAFRHSVRGRRDDRRLSPDRYSSEGSPGFREPREGGPYFLERGGRQAGPRGGVERPRRCVDDTRGGSAGGAVAGNEQERYRSYRRDSAGQEGERESRGWPGERVRGSRCERRAGRSDDEGERGRGTGDRHVPWYARASRYSSSLRPVARPHLASSPVPHCSSHVPVLRKAAKESLRATFRRFVLRIGEASGHAAAAALPAACPPGSSPPVNRLAPQASHDDKSGGNHHGSCVSFASVGPPPSGDEATPSPKSQRRVPGDKEVAEPESAKPGRGDAEKNIGQRERHAVPSRGEGDSADPVAPKERDPPTRRSTAEEHGSPVERREGHCTEGAEGVGLSPALEGQVSQPQSASATCRHAEEEDLETCEAKEASKTGETDPQGATHTLTERAQQTTAEVCGKQREPQSSFPAHHERAEPEPPRVAILLTSLPNLRLAPLHRMITTHYKMHEAASSLLLLATSPSTGRCRGYGVLLLQSFAAAERIFRAPLFTWRAAGGDGRPGGCRIPSRASAASASSLSLCAACAPSARRLRSAQLGAAPPPALERGRPRLRAASADGVRKRRCARLLPSRAADLRTEVQRPRRSPFRGGSPREGGGRGKGGSADTDGRARPGAHARRGGREAGRLGGERGGGPGKGEEPDREKQPLCDRAVKLHLLVSPTLQLQFNARIAELLTPATWSRCFSSSLWTQLFESIFVRPASLSVCPSAASPSSSAGSPSLSCSQGEGDASGAALKTTRSAAEVAEFERGEESLGQPDASLLRKGVTYFRRPASLSLECQELERLGATAAAVSALLQTNVYATSKRVYVNLPHASVHALLLRAAGLPADMPFFAAGEAATQRTSDSGKADERESGVAKSELEPVRQSQKEGEGHPRRGGDSPGPTRQTAKSSESASPPGIRGAQGEGGGAPTGPEGHDAGAAAPGKTVSAGDTRAESREADCETPQRSRRPSESGPGHEAGRCRKRPRSETGGIDWCVLEMLQHGCRPITFSMGDEGARYSIEPLPKATDDWYPWHVKYYEAAGPAARLSQAVGDALDALLRTLVEQDRYPIEYLAFEGVHFGNAWLTPPPAAAGAWPIADLSGLELGRAARACQRSKAAPLRWGEALEKTLLPHVLLVRGLPNAVAERVLQSLEEMTVELWGSWLVNRETTTGAPKGRASASSAPRSSPLVSLDARKATEVVEQELWGWQLFDFPETRMLRGDGFLLLPSCLDAKTALSLLSAWVLPRCEDRDSSAATPFSVRAGKPADLSPEPVSPLLLPLLSRAAPPSAPHVFAVMPFEVSSHLKSRDLPFLVALINSVLRHLLHRCVASSACCCSLLCAEGEEAGERMCCSCASCLPKNRARVKMPGGAHVPDEETAAPRSPAPTKNDSDVKAEKRRIEAHPASPGFGGRCEASGTGVPTQPCACCCCVEEVGHTSLQSAEESLSAKLIRQRRRRRTALGTAQVARGWMVGMPPLQVRPALPFRMPYAPLITTRTHLDKKRDTEDGRRDPEEDDFLPAPVCGAEHMIESLFFSLEAFFQLPLLQPFFSVRTADECRELAAAMGAGEAAEARGMRETEEARAEDGASMTGDDEEEGEMEEEEESNDDVWHLQKRENRWRRIGSDALQTLASQHEERSAASVSKRVCAFHSGPGALPDDSGHHSESSGLSEETGNSEALRGPREAAAETRGECSAVIGASRAEGNEEEAPKQETPGTHEANGSENERGISTLLKEAGAQEATVKSEPSAGQQNPGEGTQTTSSTDSHQRGAVEADCGSSVAASASLEGGRETGGCDPGGGEVASRKGKKLLVRLDARPTLEDAHSIRITSEALTSLEAAGKFRFLPLSVLFFTPNFRSNFEQGFFPSHAQPDAADSPRFGRSQQRYSPKRDEVRRARRSGSPRRVAWSSLRRPERQCGTPVPADSRDKNASEIPAAMDFKAEALRDAKTQPHSVKKVADDGVAAVPVVPHQGIEGKTGNKVQKRVTEVKIEAELGDPRQSLRSVAPAEEAQNSATRPHCAPECEVSERGDVPQAPTPDSAEAEEPGSTTETAGRSVLPENVEPGNEMQLPSKAHTESASLQMPGSQRATPAACSAEGEQHT